MREGCLPEGRLRGSLARAAPRSIFGFPAGREPSSGDTLGDTVCPLLDEGPRLRGRLVAPAGDARRPLPKPAAAAAAVEVNVAAPGTLASPSATSLQ